MTHAGTRPSDLSTRQLTTKSPELTTHIGAVRGSLKRIRLFVDATPEPALEVQSRKALDTVETVIAAAKQTLDSAGNVVGEDLSIAHAPEDDEVHQLWTGIDHLHMAKFHLEDLVNDAWSPNDHQTHRLLSDAVSALSEAFECFDSFTETTVWANILVHDRA